MPKCDIYRFEEHDGKYVITEKATLPHLSIERILGKVVIKNGVYEKVELKSGIFGSACDGIYLTKRKNLTYSIVKQFIETYSNGTRSVQRHPYTDDLFDDELLDDIGMTVLTYKYFYSGDDRLVDTYYPVKKEDVTEELLSQLEETSKQQMEEAARLRAHWAKLREDAAKGPIWISVKNKEGK